MKLSKLTASRPTEATIDVFGDTIVVVYDRAGIDGKLFGRPTMREKVAHILISWDVTSDDGTPYIPPSGVNGERPSAWLGLFEPLPDDVIAAVYGGILDDYYGGNIAGGDSSTT